MTKLEVFFDCSSPWTYLGFINIQGVAEQYGIDITWRPFMVGGVFNTVNDSVYKARENPVPIKAAYAQKDLADWARITGINIKMPPSIFPINSVKAMRGCLIAEPEGKLVDFATRVFEAYWSEDRDISNDDVLADLCDDAGLDQELFFNGIAQQETKDALKANTQDLIDRGGFGSPTFFINDTDMYFGNDRIPLIHNALERLGG